MDYCNIDIEMVKSIFPKRKKNSHKGTYGHVLNISGSNEYRGAAYLSSIGAYKAGCGLVTLASTEKVIDVVSNYNPMIIYLPLLTTNFNPFAKVFNINKILKNIKNYNTICIGCGLGINSGSVYLVKNLFNSLKDSNIPFVIDADAINIIAKEKIKILPKNSIITPHPKELSRLLDMDVNEIEQDRIKACIKASKKYNTITILKGEKTLISSCDGQKIYINESGNSALSKAGSGDVLSGLISGFLAQIIKDESNNASTSEKLIQSAIISVYLHGLAGEDASFDLTSYSALQNVIINSIRKQIKNLI